MTFIIHAYQSAEPVELIRFGRLLHKFADLCSHFETVDQYGKMERNTRQSV